MIKNDDVTVESALDSKAQVETIIKESILRLQKLTGMDIIAVELESSRHEGINQANTITGVEIKYGEAVDSSGKIA